MKFAVIDSIRGFFVFSQEMTDEQTRELKSLLDEDTVKRTREQYSDEVEEYEKYVGIKFDTPDQHALIPSCRWLQGMSVLDESEVDEIRRIRNRRNEIAHELPSLLIGEDSEINIDLFQRMRELLRKIDVFWAKAELQFDLQTLNEVNMDSVRDQDILSSREIVLNVIAETVGDYLAQLANESGGDPQPVQDQNAGFQP